MGAVSAWHLSTAAGLAAASDVTPKMRLFREEVFGPVTPVFKFSTGVGSAGSSSGWHPALDRLAWAGLR